MNWIRLYEPPSTAASVLTVSVLARPGHAFEQHVPAGEQADQQPLEHRVLSDDHALDLVKRLPQGGARLARAARAALSMSFICSP